MTDEDTDDNDRMNRADRLREMREGRRRGRSRDGDTDERPTADGAGETDDTETESDEATETSDRGSESEMASEDQPVDDATTSTEPESTAADSTNGQETEPAPSAADSTNGQETETEDDGSGVEESGFEFDDSPEKAVAHDEKAEKTDVDAPAVADDAAEPQTGVAQTVSTTDASSAVDNLNAGNTFAIPDQATTVTEEDDQSTLDGAEQSVAAARAAAASRGTAHVGARTRVLEFELGDERFCLDIDYIEEIVELENMTRVPNSPSFVEGVVDLRGQVTTIINPKDALEVEEEVGGSLIIVFDSEEVGDQGHLGWVVDEVRQVTPVSDDEVNDSPDEDAEYINGIINREDEDDFVVWTTPELALNSS
ncbi:chemotaxis protein CheW [Halorientalis brevis]|uniref:Chemotaxis protein CheW n=1 Tax=Halorientalis brevis TaxID=1126241 RepID=A0ABD6CCF3_9EURY|nr:chemotaxis protein CheW [Halorientalis brevis]